MLIFCFCLAQDIEEWYDKRYETKFASTDYGGFYMKIELETGNGEVVIESDVIAQFAGLSAIECFGIVGMATVNVKDGLVKLLRGDSVSKGVNVVVGENNSITIDFHIIVAYGVCISTVAENLMSTVRYKVEEFTGMQVEKINVYVEGVRVID